MLNERAGIELGGRPSHREPDPIGGDVTQVEAGELRVEGRDTLYALLRKAIDEPWMPEAQIVFD